PLIPNTSQPTRHPIALKRADDCAPRQRTEGTTRFMPPTPPTDERLVLALPEGEALPVAWHAPFFEYTGYADEARAFVQAASPRWPVHARPLDRGDPSFLATLAIEERRRMEALVGMPESENYVNVIHAPGHAAAR